MLVLLTWYTFIFSYWLWRCYLKTNTLILGCYVFRLGPQQWEFDFVSTMNEMSTPRHQCHCFFWYTIHVSSNKCFECWWWSNTTLVIITRVSEVIMFSPCVFVCLFVSLSRCLSGRFNYEGLVPHKQYFAGTLLGMSSCASYVSRTHDVIDDVTRSQSRSNFESDISPSIFELERRSKAQNVRYAHGYLSGLFNFRYNFR